MLRNVILACWCCGLLLGAGVLAQDNVHPLETAELIHELDLSQTIDAVTVTLDWAYADTLGFVVHVTVADLPPAIAEAFNFTVTPAAKLRDPTGFEFSFQSGGFGLPDEAGQLAGTISYYPQAVREDAVSGEWEINNDYFRSQYDSLPDMLPLQFELSFVDPASQFAPMPDATGQMPPTADPAFEPIGPFLFDFSVPLPTPIELEPNQTVEVKDLAMTLETLAITPAHASARLCLELPDPSGWQPRPSIQIDGVDGYWTGGGIHDMAEFQNPERRCFDMQFDAAHTRAANVVILSLDAIEKSLSEGPGDWERIQVVLAEQGIDMTVISQGHGTSVDIPGLPDDMTFQEVIEMAREQLGDRIVGPWVFEIALP